MISAHEQRTTNGLYIGWLTLNLPQTLNALTLDMARAARTQLAQWATRPNIACVVIQGEGRGFCAGGDVRRMRKGVLDGDDYCERFFEQEYRLDYAIHRYPKPVLCWAHGVTMGGGVGLLIGASHRVVTESSRLAMPEISIGLYPDVGASYFLNQLPQGLGLFLGISGCEWNGADAIALKMADYLLADSSKHDLPALLADLDWSNSTTDNRVVLSRGLHQLPAADQSLQLCADAERIAAVCSAGLQAAATQLPTLAIADKWFVTALDNLHKGCPVTAHLVQEQLQRAKGLGLPDVFRMEWTMSVQCARHPDFIEGVRAQLVDKDKQPRWQFPSIEAVPREYVLAHFAPAHHGATDHPLQDLA
jgi:enoyl-CoA hydratase/carnithine racemase